MKYYIEELGENYVKSKTPLNALKKIVRKLICNMKKINKDIYKIQNEHFTLIDENDYRQIYLVSIVKNNSDVQKSIYYKLDYEIEIYKKLKNI